MRHLHLILQARHELHADALGALPGLNKLRGKGRPLPAPAGLGEACCLSLGIARQQDWPIAPFTARAAGLDVGDAYWLRLDPVYLDVGMQGLFLRGGLFLDDKEAAGIHDIAFPLLGRAGLQAFPGPGGVIHVRCGGLPRLATTPLDQVDGRQPTRFLPTGADAPAWARLLHELQMALHEHPVNQARMAAGKPPVNSFWPWGGGRFAAPNRLVDAVWGDAPLPGQLAAALDIPVHPCPAGLDRVLAEKMAGGLVLLGIGTAGEGAGDPPEVWEQAWLRPLVSALRWGRLASARISLLGPEGEAWALTPLDLWRIRT